MEGFTGLDTNKFTWRIENFTRLSTRKHYSEIFIVHGYKWRIIIYAKGNNVDYLSMYLDVADSMALPSGWTRYTQFSLAVVNQINSRNSLKRDSEYQFNTRESYWGFRSFMPLGVLHDPSRGYLVNDTVVVEVKISLKKEQGKLYTTIKVARDEDLAEQIGRDIYFDLVDHDRVRSFPIKKQASFSLFKEEVAKEFGIPVQFQRFWFWTKRQNFTYRPMRPLTPVEESKSVGELYSSKKYTQLNLFLEVNYGQDLRPIPPPERSKEDILLFFKLYEPEKQELRFVGRLYVNASSLPIEILEKLNQLAGFSIEEEIEIYEEIKFEPSIMCELVDKWTSFRSSQIEDGDIICFQKSTRLESEEERKYSDVPSFLEYLKNRQIVHFRSLEKPTEGFILELSRIHTYDDVVEALACQIGLEDPTKIRLTTHNSKSKQPNLQPINYRGVGHLKDMLVHDSHSSDILYYEVLEIPLPELQGLKNLKVAFHHAIKDELVIHNIKLPKRGTVGDVLYLLKPKVQLSHPNAELRLLEVFYHKIHKIFPCSEKLENINDQCWTLRAEEIPEEEKNLGLHNRLIQVYHFTKESAQNQQVQNFGEPFFLVIHEGETLAEVKVRVQKKLQVPDEEFSKWKFTFLSIGRPEYLQDSDILSCRLQKRDFNGAWEQYLGLEHSLNAAKRTSAVNQDTDPVHIATPHIPAIMETSQPQEHAKKAEVTVCPDAEAAQVTLDSLGTDSVHRTAIGDIETQKDPPQVLMSSFQDFASPSSPKDDRTLRRLYAAKELLKWTPASEPSPEASAALATVSLYVRSSLDTFSTDGACEEFSSALKLLNEQGMIPLRITSVLKDLLEPLEGEMCKYVAAEKELAQGKEYPAKYEEIRALMELSIQKCQERKDIVANYDARVAELEAELAQVKAKRAEAMVNLDTALDAIEPVKQSFADSSSNLESFIVKQAMLTVQKDASLRTWVVIKDVLKNFLKLQ